jgi:FkbM family methyltransferase
MKARVFLRFFIILIKIFTIGISLLMIPIILLVSVLLPWKGITTLFLFILPLTLFILWLVRRMACRKLDRKTSLVSFYAVFIASAIFWLVFLGISANIYLQRIPLKKMAWGMSAMVNDMARIKYQEPARLFFDKNPKSQLFKDYLRFGASAFFPSLRNPNDIRILNYHVRSYDFLPASLLFLEIFISQQYYFRANTPSPWIIDCGSHIGLSILYFKALYPQAKILGFEPAPETYKLLKENVERNHLKNVILMKKAVSNQEGKMKFYGDSSLTSSLLPERGSPNSIEVDVVKLSTYIDRNVDFLKIDVEGAEDLVLDDLVASGKLGMVSQMVIEYHHHIKKDADRLSQFLKVLEDHNFGYQIEGSSQPPYRGMEFEDIMIYAYQK